MAEIMVSKAHIFDIDDTLLLREPVTRLVGFAKGRINPRPLLSYNLDDIPLLDRNLQSKPIASLMEKLSFIAHSKRIAIPGVKELLEYNVSQGIHNYVSSGRPNKEEWGHMTMLSLDQQRLLKYLKDIHLTPKGIPTAVSKAATVREISSQYEETEFSDDDLKTVLFIARLFPGVTVNYIRHRLTNIPVPNEEIAKLPNLRVIPIALWKQQALYAGYDTH